MKKLWIRTGSFILACILCLGAMTSVFADYSDADTVTLTGSGTVFIPADIAVIRFCIETHAKKESSAKAQNDEILETLMAYEEDFGQIAEDSYYSFEDPNSGRMTVSRCLSLTTDEVESVPELTEHLIDNGATAIHGVWYSVKNVKPYEEEALRLAIQNAESKAGAMGLTLRISEISDYGCYQRCDGYDCSNGNGQIVLECNVSVVYKRR